MFQYALPLSILLLLMFLVFRLKKLTAGGTLIGGAVAIGVFAGAGYQGVLMLAAFFAMATLATSWQKAIKERHGLQEQNKGKRNAWQVLANGGVPALLGLTTIFFPQFEAVIEVMIAGAFSAATADTLSSELGNVYGRKYFNILSFKADQRGLDGVVSLEGTLAGLAGSVIIAFIYCYGDNGISSVLLITVAGLIGNLCDSYLGAALERKGSIGNNFVNFINTLIGALSSLLLIHLF